MNWKPQDDYVVRLSDETAEKRTEAELQEMVDKIRPIVNEYGFDLSSWGGWEGLRILAFKGCMGDFYEWCQTRKKA